MKINRENRRQLAAFAAMGKILGSSLLNSELIHALLQEFHEETPFSVAVVMQVQEQTPDHLSVIDILSTIPLNVGIGSHAYTGSLLEGVIRQGNILSLNAPTQLRHPLELELVVKPGILSLVLAPLKTGSKVTGLLMLGDVRADAFDGMEEKAETVASLLALAMEKTRLSGSVTKRDQEMESIKQIGGILAASTFDRQEVFKHTMDMIRTIMNVEAGSLLLIEDGELAFKVAFNSNPACDIATLESLRVRLGQGIAGYAAARGEAVIVSDTRDSRQFAPEFDLKTGFETRSILCVPLISRGRVLGVIEVINKLNDAFHDGDLHLLQSIATSVSIALENSQLYQETLSMAEQERGIRNMFQKFVPRVIVDKIIHHTETERLLLEELKILTLLNIDIRGFSTLSKKIGPQRTVAILNQFFATMGEIVFKHQGIVDKYLGDGFLAVFGAPVSAAGDADHAIAAALEMKSSLARVNDHFAEELEEPLSMGISLHTGEAVVGNIGFEKKMDYTVIGDSVNAVFRLQDLTKSRPNSILISEKTRSAAMNSILDARDIGICNAGTTLGELKIYELLGAHPRGVPLP
jgi:class 3 adenylate cyclase